MIVMTWNSISLLAGHLETIIGYKTAAHAGVAPFSCHRRLKNNRDVWERAWIEPRLTPCHVVKHSPVRHLRRTEHAAFPLMICLRVQLQVDCHNIGPWFVFKAAERLSSPAASSSCSFRVKFSQTLDFLLQTSHSNTLASPPRFFFPPK